MKTFITIFAILFLATTSKAQLEKGTWLAGGYGNYTNLKRDYKYLQTNSITTTKESQITILPNIGYFFIDKLGVGLRSYYSKSKGDGIGASSGLNSFSNRIGFGPFIRYYFLSLENSSNILLDVQYQTGKWNLAGIKGDIQNFSINAGPCIFFNNSVSAEFLLGYFMLSEELQLRSLDKSKGFNFSIGLQIHLKK